MRSMVLTHTFSIANTRIVTGLLESRDDKQYVIDVDAIDLHIVTSGNNRHAMLSIFSIFKWKCIIHYDYSFQERTQHKLYVITGVDKYILNF